MRVLDRLLLGIESVKDLLVNNRFRLVKGDIRHIEDVTAAMANIDAVIDLAAIVGAPACDNNKENTIETNYLATKLLAQIAQSHGVKRFIFASTCSVYGANDGKALTEESPTNPLSLYAETKMKSEDVLLNANGSLEPVILRLSTLCGPSSRMRFDLVLNFMAAMAYNERKLKVIGGNQWRPLLDTRDASAAFCKLLETPLDVSHTVWNVGSNGNNITICKLGELIANQVEGTEIEYVPGQEDPRSYKVVFDKINNRFTPSITMEKSVQDVLKMFEEGRVTNYKSSKYYNSKLNYFS